MENAIYLMLFLALAGLIYICVKAVLVARHVGFAHFVKAVGTLVGAVSLAGWRLLSRARAARGSSLNSEPLDFSGTGGRYNARTGNYDNGQDPYGIYPEEQGRDS
jgi:hypothetical protein